MRIVIQRVSHASVTIEGHCKSSIRKGRKFHIAVAVKPFHPRIQVTSGQIVIPACRQGIIFHILGVYAV